VDHQRRLMIRFTHGQASNLPEPITSGVQGQTKAGHGERFDSTPSTLDIATKSCAKDCWRENSWGFGCPFDVLAKHPGAARCL